MPFDAREYYYTHCPGGLSGFPSLSEVFIFSLFCFSLAPPRIRVCINIYKNRKNRRRKKTKKNTETDIFGAAGNPRDGGATRTRAVPNFGRKCLAGRARWVGGWGGGAADPGEFIKRAQIRKPRRDVMYLRRPPTYTKPSYNTLQRIIYIYI